MLFKLTALIICIFMMGSLFLACEKKDDTTKSEAPPEEESKTIQFWYWNPDEGKVFKEAIEGNTDLTVNLTITNMDGEQYQTKLETNFKSGKYFADIAGAEAGFIQRVKNQPNGFTDLSVAPFNAEADLEELATYAVDVGRNKDGAPVLVPNQATPCKIAYKRDLAEKVFGSGEPAEVAKEFATTDAILAAAEKAKAKGIKIVPGPNTFLEIYLGARTDPWVKDNKFTIDPKMDEYLDLSKKLRDLGVDGKLDDWSEPWNASFTDDEILSYLCPTWFGPYIIQPKMLGADEEDGTDDDDKRRTGGWAVVDGPFSSYWGGNWLGILEKTEAPNNAWAAVKVIGLNGELIEKRVTGGDVPDFSANMTVMDKLAGQADLIYPLFNQNYFAEYAEAAKKINGSLATDYDDIIKKEFQDQVKLFLEGQKDKDKMISDFIEKIKPQLQAKGVQFD